MSIARSLLIAVFLALPLAKPAAFPDRFDASYSLHAGDLEVGTTSVSLSPSGDGRFEYTTVSRTTGVASLLGLREVRERSVWEASGPHIRSLRYDYQRLGSKERQVEVVFDWSTGRVTNYVNGDIWHMDVPDPTFDRQNYVLALMRDLAAGARPSSYQIADGGKLKTYEFNHLGRERVSTALGSFETLVVERTQPDATRRTTFWCAPFFDYLPVQIEHREEKGSIFVRIRDASGFGQDEGEGGGEFLTDLPLRTPNTKR